MREKNNSGHSVFLVAFYKQFGLHLHSALIFKKKWTYIVFSGALYAKLNGNPGKFVLNGIFWAFHEIFISFDQLGPKMETFIVDPKRPEGGNSRP